MPPSSWVVLAAGRDHFLYVQVAPRIEFTHLCLTRSWLRNIEEIKNGDLARGERQVRMGCGSD